MFPEVNMLGCGFHFNQCLYRRIQSDAAPLEKYVSDLDFSLDMKMFPASAYVLVQAVRSTFNLLTTLFFDLENERLLTEFINYFGIPRE